MSEQRSPCHIMVNGRSVSGDYILQDGDEVSVSPKGPKNAAPEYFPDGRPVPELLTPKEACVFLRLDVLHEGDTDRALDALSRLTNGAGIRAVCYAGKGGGQRVYPRKSLLEFIERQLEERA